MLGEVVRDGSLSFLKKNTISQWNFSIFFVIFAEHFLKN